MNPKVMIVLGNISDLKIAQKATDTFEKFKFRCEIEAVDLI